MKILVFIIALFMPAISVACSDHPKWIIEVGAGVNDGVNWDDQGGTGAYGALRHERKYSVFHITHGSQWGVNNDDESTLTHIGLALRLEL